MNGDIVVRHNRLRNLVFRVAQVSPVFPLEGDELVLEEERALTESCRRLRAQEAL